MKCPLISIIVPVYNVEDYLRRCLDSIINQTYKNLEIILVDDGSTDKSGEICDEYKAKDKRIIVIHQKNQGLSAARNAGLDIFKGEYISFIDSDDYVDLRFIENLFINIVANDADVSVCSSFAIKKDGRTKDENICDDILTDYKTISSIVVWTKLYKKYLFNNIRFPVGKLCEDSFVFYPVLYRANKIICSSNRLYYHNVYNSRSIMSNHSKKLCKDLCEGTGRMVVFAKENGVEIELINKWFRWIYDFFIIYYEKYRKDDINEYYAFKKSFKRTANTILSKLHFRKKLIALFPTGCYFLLKLLRKFHLKDSIYSLD